ncbi:hypothetical protein HPB51_018817 [Rhipicephalus microplus]|uniref:Uncharacterized protein n=1 Tax=Rhipicephalus microplus TaxID=6941 RepID=A0A9J6DBG2_RHIMP|nr:hypothetical protein HPB51_018817 [Rhipicephalus microplus]
MPRYPARRSSSFPNPPDDNGLFATLRNHIASSVNDVDDQFRSHLNAGARESSEAGSTTTPAISRAGSLADASVSPRRLSVRKESSAGSVRSSGRDTPSRLAADGDTGEGGGGFGFGATVAHISSAFRSYLADMTTEPPLEPTFGAGSEERLPTPPVRKESLGRFSVAPVALESTGPFEESAKSACSNGISMSAIREDLPGFDFCRRSWDAVPDPNTLGCPRGDSVRPENTESHSVAPGHLPATVAKKSRRSSSLVQLKRFAKFRLSLRNGKRLKRRPSLRSYDDKHKRFLELHVAQRRRRNFPRTYTWLAAVCEAFLRTARCSRGESSPELRSFSWEEALPNEDHASSITVPSPPENASGGFEPSSVVQKEGCWLTVENCSRSALSARGDFHSPAEDP